tara:strand:- start:2728 stop:2934 length:207 start_codon:yes stop_codon:yes gene_type:complete
MQGTYPVTEFESKAEFFEWLEAFNGQAGQPKVSLENINSCHQLTLNDSGENCANIMLCKDGRVEVRFW